jgi:segregation and condensation protein B
MSPEAQIEGILFYAARPMTYAELAKATGIPEAGIKDGLLRLRDALSARGIALIEERDTVALMTAPALAEKIEAMRKEELKRDIGKAGAETLAIIAYLGSATRTEIDFIRGVNSTFILRNLMVRGLIERTDNENDRRSFAYKPTLELYAHLGITRKEDLPHYAEMLEEIAKYQENERAQGAETAP